jgi:hypothetical protein
MQLWAACPFGRTHRLATFASAKQRGLDQPFMMRAKIAWCSHRGVAQTIATAALLLKPGTTLMRPACSADI